MYLGHKVGTFRPSAEFAVRVEGEQDEPKASAFCELKRNTATTQGQKAH